MASIKRPGVEVTQQNITERVTVTSPLLTPVIVGPCKQIVEAFNDSGVVQSEALAGTYQDGKGTVAYAMPSIKTGAVVDSASVRVFRVDGAGASTELRDSSSESAVYSGTSGVYNGTTGFTDSSNPFIANGVLKGDFVRVTYRSEVVDLEITGTPAAGTLAVSNGIAQTDPITFSSYSIVRNPPQFVFQSSVVQADAEIGDVTDPETNYLHVAIKSTAAATLTGAAGDGFSVQLKETDPDYTISHAATGTAVATGTALGTQVQALNGASAGPVSVTTLAANGIAILYKAGGTPIGTGGCSVVMAAGASEADWAALAAATTLGGSAQAVPGKCLAVESPTSTTVYDHTGNASGEKIVIFSSAHGITSGMISANTAYVYIDKGTGGSGTAGLYKVASIVDTTKVLLDGSTNPGGDVATGTGSPFLVALELGSAGSAIAVAAGATTTVYDYASASTANTVLGGTLTGKSIVFGSDALASAAYNPASAVSSSGRQITVSDLTSVAAGSAVSGGASGKSAQIVTTAVTSAGFVLPTGSSKVYKITLRRVNGESTTSGSNLASDLTAITNFSDSFTATSVGSSTFTYAEAATVAFDGGADADNILVDADLIGSTTATHNIYVSYKALRVDVSDQAGVPAFVEINNTTDVTTKLGTISTDNPLALAAYFATLQSPNKTIKCLGVSATSASEPAGTTAAYGTALSFLEGQDVYALACLSTDPAIHALFKSHVTSMSLPANKSERICFVSQAMPTHVTATLLSSGTGGDTDSSFSSNYTFTTDVDFTINSALTTVLADTGTDDLILVVTAKSSSSSAPIAANGVLPVKYGIKVNKSSTSTEHASNNNKLILNSTDVASAISKDGTWVSAVDVSWSLYKMGAALSTTAQKATAVAGLGAQFASSRAYLVWPDTIGASVSGSAISAGGEYLAAAWAAKVGFEPPKTPFSNSTITGFSSVTNSNGLFSRSQLDEIAGGGTFITIQDSPSAALSCRHQLSTDVSTIQKRELSVVKTVDYVAKEIRAALEPRIGSFLITQSYLDSLGTLTEGIIVKFVEDGTLKSGKVNFVEVDSTDIDTVNVQVIIAVHMPSNYIALTLQF